MVSRGKTDRAELKAVASEVNFPAAWFTSSEAVANEYAKLRASIAFWTRQDGDFSPNVIAAYTRGKIKRVEGLFRAPDFDKMAIILEQAKNEGYDGVEFKRLNDRPGATGVSLFNSSNVLAMFDTTKIRRVDAAFDPEKASSPNLMFALRSEPDKSLQSIVADLARDLGLTVRQGLSKTAAGKAARRAGLGSVYDPSTGILRVSSVSDINAIATAAAPALRHRFGRKLDAIITANATDLADPDAGSPVMLSPLQKALADAVQTEVDLANHAGHQSGGRGAAIHPAIKGGLGGALAGGSLGAIAGNAAGGTAGAIVGGGIGAMVGSAVGSAGHANQPAKPGSDPLDRSPQPQPTASYAVLRDEAAAALGRLAALTDPVRARARVDAVKNLSSTYDLDSPFLISRMIVRTFDSNLAPIPAKPIPQSDADAGFAAFVRDFIVNPRKAKNAQPHFMRVFTEFMQAHDDILLNKLEDTQDAIDTWYQADPARFVDAIIHDPKKQGWLDTLKADADQWGWAGAFSIRLSNLYRDVIDANHPMFTATWDLLHEIERQTGKKIDLAAADNPYKLLRMAPHSHAWATLDMERGVRNYKTGAHEGPGIITAMTTALGTKGLATRNNDPGTAYRAFSSYLVARYAAVEWGRFRDGTKERAPTIMPPRAGSPEEAIRHFNEARAALEAQYPTFAAAADQIYDYQANLFTLQRHAGLISQEAYDQHSGDREYVPFYREFDETETASSRTIGGGPHGVLKRRRGSDRNVVDPIASIAQKTFETRQLIAMNDTKRALMSLSDAAGPGGGVIAERIDPKQLVGMGVDVDQIIKSAAKDNDVDPSETMALVSLAHELLGNDAVATYYTQRVIQAGNKPIVFFWEDGKIAAMQLGDGGHGHKLAAQMLDSLNTFGKVHTDAMNALLTIGRLPANITRLGVTTHPEFAAANLVRDAIMAFQYDKRALPIWTQIKGMANVARGAEHVQRFYANAGMMGGEATAALDKLRLNRDTSALMERGFRLKMFDSVEDFMAHVKVAMKESMAGAALAGGTIGGAIIGAAAGPLGVVAGGAAGAAGTMSALKAIGAGRNAGDKALGLGVGVVAGAAIGGPIGAGIGGVIGRMVGAQALVKIGEASETATRAELHKIAFERAKANGLDDVAAVQEANFWAHDYTDYSRRGSRMEGLAAIIPFLNANLQGNDTYIRRLAGKGDQSYMPGLMYPLYRLGWLDVTKLSDAERRQLGESAWTWGMTILGLGTISAVVAMMSDDDDEIKDIDDRVKAGHWIIRIGDSIVRIPKPFQTVWFSQLVERSITEARHNNARWYEHYLEDLWNTWKPPITPSIAEVGATMMGYDINSGRNVVPDFVKRSNPDITKQADAYTSEFGQWAAKQLGGISPMMVDHMITKFGATWGRTALNLNVPGTPWYDPQKPTRGPEEEFISRRFMWKAGRGSEAGQALRQVLGAEDPLSLLWRRIAQPYSNLKTASDNYKDLVDKPVPDHAAAIEYLKTLSPYERGFALLETHFKGPNDSKYRMLHPVNRAERITSEALKMEKEIVGGELLSGRRGKDLKEVPMTPTEKSAARDILTQLRMMEAHNALVLTDEIGWKGRQVFDTATVMGELKAAAPAAHKELLARFTKAGVLSWDGVAKTWPDVKRRLEDDALLSRVGRLKMTGAAAVLAAPYAIARVARPGSWQPVVPQSAAPSPAPAPSPIQPPAAVPPGMMRLGGPEAASAPAALAPPVVPVPKAAPRLIPKVAPKPIEQPEPDQIRVERTETGGIGNVVRSYDKPAAADIKLDRDKTGRISTVQKSGVAYQVDRDEHGRIVGLKRQSKTKETTP